MPDAAAPPEYPHTRHSGAQRLVTMIGTVLLALMALVGPGSAAVAAPSPSQVEDQITATWNQLEPMIEQYNRVNASLQQTKTKADALAQQIAPLSLQVQLAMAHVGTIGASLYQTGPDYALSTLLRSGSAANLLDQLTTLNHFAQDESASVAAVAAQRDQLAAAKRPYDQLVAQLAGQQADLESKKAAIEAQMTNLQQLRTAAYGVAGQTDVLRPVAACPVDYFGDNGSRAAKVACSLIGKPYIWAAAGPTGYDCSGLTMVAWASVGVSMGHFTQWQFDATKPVNRADLRPGDLVFFFSDHHHVGIYVGGGWMVNAPSTGDHVRMAKIDNPYLPISGLRRPG